MTDIDVVACFTSYPTLNYILCHSLSHTVTYCHILSHISREQQPCLPCGCLRNGKGTLRHAGVGTPGVQDLQLNHIQLSYMFIHLHPWKHPFPTCHFGKSWAEVLIFNEIFASFASFEESRTTRHHWPSDIFKCRFCSLRTSPPVDKTSSHSANGP